MAPPRVSVPRPCLPKPPPAPPMTPLSVTAESMARVRTEAPRPTEPEKVRAPLSAALPSATLPATVSALVRVRAVAPSELNVPPTRVIVPVPKAAAWPARRTPALRVVPAE